MSSISISRGEGSRRSRRRPLSMRCHARRALLRAIAFASSGFRSDNIAGSRGVVMDIAKVLVPVTGGGRDASLLLYAIEAAKPFNAHVMAFFVRPDLAEALAFFSDGAS